MRNFKRFLSFMMAMLMVFGMLVFNVGAADEADYTDAAHNLAAIGIMKGDENGNLMLNENVTRYQAALFFVQAITGDTDPSVWNAEKSAIFSDVPEYGTAIDYLAGLGYIIGRGNGIYGYHDNITYQDMLVLAVRTLGYETENMSYPYGYILAAQKLGLTDNIEGVNYKDYLTRGETAQLVWDMLGTEIAFIDPLTNDIIYPGKEDESAYGAVVGAGKINRETYLERAGFASGKMVVTVTEFTPAVKEEPATVTVNYGGESHVILASDLGISENTPKIEYLGLPKTLYVNCKAEDFFAKYDIDGEGEAKIVFVSDDALTEVQNLGADGTIRYVEGAGSVPYIMLGGAKFAYDKYDIALHTFGEEGWSQDNLETFEENFLYNTKDGYIGANSNGVVKYIVRESGDTKTLHIYYTPYEFGQYFVRNLKDATTLKNADFVTLAKYESTAIENIDKEKSNFVEYLVGTNQKITSATTSVSKKNGEKAKSVTTVGEEVKSGDFVFYYYNPLDNIITVAKNAGGFKTGALSGTSAAKETVKIGGTTYGFGFKGAYDASYADYAANAATIKNAMAAYEGGYDNVRFVTVDSNIVFIEQYKAKSEAADYNFAVVSTDKALIADLLGIKEEKLDITADFVLDKNGNVYVAVLDTAKGEWALASLGLFHKDYNESEGEYEKYGDLGDMAKYVDIAGESYSKYALYNELKTALNGSNIFAIVKEGDTIELGTAENIDSAVISEGLIFSDITAKTNKIKAESDASVQAARVTLNGDSVIVIIDGEGNVGVRHGVQKEKFTVNGAARFYAASEKLIVAYFEEPVFVGGFENAADWGESRAAVTSETYYIALPESEISFEANGEDAEEKYTVTITELLDLRTLEIADEKSFTTNEAINIDLAKALHADENGIITEAGMTLSEAFKAARALDGGENDITYVNIAPENLTFTDADTVTVSGGALSLPNALAGVNANVITIDASGIDKEDYDFGSAVLNVEYGDGALGGSEAEISDGFYGYEYIISEEVVQNITEPTEGVLDQFILNSAGMEILIPVADADNYEGAASVKVNLTILANYDEDTGILNMYVLKVIA